VLSDDGIDLADVYQISGEVLMGTLRWEHENRARDQERRMRLQARSARLGIELEQAELRARLEAVRRALAAKGAELQEVRSTEVQRVDLGERRYQSLMAQRQADIEAPSNKTYQGERAAARTARRRSAGGGTTR
jgi:hypothetical protein